MSNLANETKDFLRRVRRTARALGGRDLLHAPQMRRKSVRLGSDYGGWWLLPELLTAQSVVYSFGIGDDISFDLALIEHSQCVVHGFDPTPRCIRWIEKQNLPEKFQFHPIGLADFDGDAQFVMENENPEWSSYSLNSDAKGAFETVNCRVERLSTVCKSLNHSVVDLIKIDIEGAEYSVLKDILAGSIRPKQLLVEFHYFEGGNDRLRQTKEAIEALNKAGYKIFARSAVGYEFSLLLTG